jgi:hypothetical protein
LKPSAIEIAGIDDASSPTGEVAAPLARSSGG